MFTFPSLLVVADGDVYLVYRPDFIKDSLSDTSQGRFVASVSRVKHAGHMVGIRPKLSLLSLD